MKKKFNSSILMLQMKKTASLLRFLAWCRYGYKYDVSVAPDIVYHVDPMAITHKPLQKPPSNFIKHSLVRGGSWDTELEPITDDEVYSAFVKRFKDRKEWNETGYIDYLTKGISEHSSTDEYKLEQRCEAMDELYQSIKSEGYKSQHQLIYEKNDGLLSNFSLPPAYGEIAVSITRDGDFVWQAGMHRLVIAQLLEVEKVPIRIHARHKQWQAYRDHLYQTQETLMDIDHPDLNCLVK